MSIFYLKGTKQVEYTSFCYPVFFYFNSHEALEAFEERWVQSSSLNEVIETGKAHFNSNGVLVP